MVNLTIERMIRTTRMVQIVVIIFLCFVIELDMINYESTVMRLAGRRTSKGKKTKIMVLALGMIASLAYKVGRVSYEKYQITRQISTIDGELKALSAKATTCRRLLSILTTIRTWRKKRAKN